MPNFLSSGIVTLSSLSTFAFINSAAKASTGASSGATTTGFDSTGANLIVIVAAYDTGGTGLIISDNKLNTYTAIGAFADNSVRMQLYYCQAPTVGTGHTFSIAGTSIFGGIAAAAFSGSIALPLDQNRSGLFFASTTGNTGGNLVPGFTNELIVAGAGYLTGVADAVSIDSSFNLGAHVPFASGASYGCGIAYIIETAKVNKDPTWTFSESASGVLQLASFKSGSSA